MNVGVQVAKDGLQVAELLYRNVSFYRPDGTEKWAWSVEGLPDPVHEFRSGTVPNEVVQDILRHISRQEPQGQAGEYELRATY